MTRGNRNLRKTARAAAFWVCHRRGTRHALSVMCQLVRAGQRGTGVCVCHLRRLGCHVRRWHVRRQAHRQTTGDRPWQMAIVFVLLVLLWLVFIAQFIATG